MFKWDHAVYYMMGKHLQIGQMLAFVSTAFVDSLPGVGFLLSNLSVTKRVILAT